MQETGLAILKRVRGAISIKKTVTGVQSRSAKLREELAEAESVEDLIRGLITELDETLDEVEKAGLSMQRATTKMRNLAKERKAQLQELLSEE